MHPRLTTEAETKPGWEASGRACIISPPLPHGGGGLFRYRDSDIAHHPAIHLTSASTFPPITQSITAHSPATKTQAARGGAEAAVRHGNDPRTGRMATVPCAVPS